MIKVECVFKKRDNNSLNEDFHLLINGKMYHPSFDISWVAQNTSWLLVMSVRVFGVLWNDHEYSDSPILDKAMIEMMARGLEQSLRKHVDSPFKEAVRKG